MTDGNTYAINKHLDDQEDYDALQEVTAELEQAEADNIMLIGRIEELELAVRYEADLAQQALDARKELEAKLSRNGSVRHPRKAQVPRLSLLRCHGHSLWWVSLATIISTSNPLSLAISQSGVASLSKYSGEATSQ